MLLVEEMTNIINHIQEERPDECLCRNSCDGDCDITFVITSFFPEDEDNPRILATHNPCDVARVLNGYDDYEIVGCEEGYGGVGTIMDIEVGPGR